MQEVDYYELLGVSENASDAEIKSAYRALAKAMHPDTGGTAGTFRLLREAYETLVDPVRRADYDQSADEASFSEATGQTGFEDMPAPPAGREPPPSARRARRGSATGRFRHDRSFGEDPAFMPAAPLLDPSGIGWWDAVNVGGRVRFAVRDAPGHGPLVLASGVVFVLLVPIVVQVDFSGLLLVVWLTLIAAVSIAVYWVVVRYRAVARGQRELISRFGGSAVFGRVGTDDDQWAERLTADLLSRYLARLPAVRIFHGVAWPGSVFADVEHAVLAGRRLVLVESKMWLPGHYAADHTGGLWRNGQRFRGGGSLLGEGIAAFRQFLPGVEVRGALIVYPSRIGEVSTAEALDTPAPPMTPAQFVEDIGAWLAEEPCTVDAEALQALLNQVVSA